MFKFSFQFSVYICLLATIFVIDDPYGLNGQPPRPAGTPPWLGGEFFCSSTCVIAYSPYFKGGEFFIRILPSFQRRGASLRGGVVNSFHRNLHRAKREPNSRDFFSCLSVIPKKAGSQESICNHPALRAPLLG